MTTTDPSRPARELVLVLGAGHRETGLTSGVLQRLGFASPRPEVVTDGSAVGSGEPRWSVRFHGDLLGRAGVISGDARPSAWTRTAEAGYDVLRRRQLSNWLSTQFERSNRIVVRDDRLRWFVPLWTRAAEDLDVEPAFLTVLRHPAAVLAAEQRSLATVSKPAHRLGAWINAMLYSERATRSSRRAFVLFDELLADWARTIRRLDQRLALQLSRTVRVQQMDAVADLVERVDLDVKRRLAPGSADDLDVAKPLAVLAEAVWAELATLASGDHEPEPVLERLDAARDEYQRAYSDAEALVSSSIAAARRWGRRAGSRSAISGDTRPATPTVKRAKAASDQGSAPPPELLTESTPTAYSRYGTRHDDEAQHRDS